MGLSHETPIKTTDPSLLNIISNWFCMLGVPLYKLGLGGLRLCGKAIIFNNVTSTLDFNDTSFIVSTFGSVS
jgi:hypothetical protein